MSDLKIEIMGLENENEKLADKCSELRMELGNLNEMIAERDARIETLTCERDKLGSVCEFQRKDLRQMKDEIASLVSEVDATLQQRNDVLAAVYRLCKEVEYIVQGFGKSDETEKAMNHAEGVISAMCGIGSIDFSDDGEHDFYLHLKNLRKTKSEEGR